MAYKFIVEVDTGEILFDLVHDLITQNIRAIKLIAKKLNAVLRQKREILDKEKIKAHALEISKELEKANPYIKVEIDSKSVKITETVESFPFKLDDKDAVYPEQIKYVLEMMNS